MSKRWKKQMDEYFVAILTCDGDESSTEGSRSDSDSNLDSEDNLWLMI